MMVIGVLLHRLTLGLIMLGFKGFGFLIALVYNFFSTLSALKEFVLRSAWPYLPFLGKRPEDKLHDVIRRVMLQVRLLSPPAPPAAAHSLFHIPSLRLIRSNRIKNCLLLFLYD